MCLRILAILLSVSTPVVLAQTLSPTPGPAAPRQQMPPRDAQALPQAGTAVIKGRITAADTGRPLRRARVTARAAELGQRGRDVSTDADGRYEIKDLPAGRYSMTVTRSGYLRLQYGQRRPLEQGKPHRASTRFARMLRVTDSPVRQPRSRRRCSQSMVRT